MKKIILASKKNHKLLRLMSKRPMQLKVNLFKKKKMESMRITLFSVPLMNSLESISKPTTKLKKIKQVKINQNQCMSNPKLMFTCPIDY